MPWSQVSLQPGLGLKPKLAGLTSKAPHGLAILLTLSASPLTTLLPHAPHSHQMKPLQFPEMCHVLLSSGACSYSSFCLKKSASSPPNSDSSCKSQLQCHFLRKASLTFQRLLPPPRYLSGVAFVTAAALPAFPVQAFPDKNASYAGWSFSSLISIWLFLCKIFNRPLLPNGKHPPFLAWHSSWLLLRCWPMCFPSFPLLPSLSTTLCHVYPNPIKVKQPLRSNSTHTYSLKPAFISGGKRTSYGSINPSFFPSLDSQISQSLYPSPHQPFFHYPTNWHLLHQN